MYSRQDEFLADKTAADIGGAENFCAGLLKVIVADYKGANVSWHDRLLQSQRDGSYTEWVRAHLVPTDAQEAAKLTQEAYSQDRRHRLRLAPDHAGQVSAHRR